MQVEQGQRVLAAHLAGKQAHMHAARRHAAHRQPSGTAGARTTQSSLLCTPWSPEVDHLYCQWIQSATRSEDGIATPSLVTCFRSCKQVTSRLAAPEHAMLALLVTASLACAQLTGSLKGSLAQQGVTCMLSTIDACSWCWVEGLLFKHANLSDCCNLPTMGQMGRWC